MDKRILISFSAFISAIFITAYFYHLGSGRFSATPADWGVFGDYVGGTVGSVLLFVSIYLLYLSLAEQQKGIRAQERSIQILNSQILDSKIISILTSVHSYDHRQTVKSFVEKISVINTRLDLSNSDKFQMAQSVISQYESEINGYVNIVSQILIMGESSNSGNIEYGEITNAFVSNRDRIAVGYVIEHTDAVLESVKNRVYVGILEQRIDYEDSLSWSENVVPNAVPWLLPMDKYARRPD